MPEPAFADGQPEALAALAEWGQQPLPISAACHDGEACTCAWKVAKARCVRPASGWVAAKRSTTGCGATCANSACRSSDAGAAVAPVGAQHLRRLDLPGRQLIDWGGAQRWLKSAPAQAIREQVAKVGGHATAYAPGDDSTAPLPAALMRYHQALKQQLDPRASSTLAACTRTCEATPCKPT
jgi:glycolate oxidase FAD binding subunit